jgi:transcriptional regulator with XRE-family HTH domain
MNNAIAARLKVMDEKASLKLADIADLVKVRPETVSRWNQGKAFPQSEPEQRLLELGYIVEQLAELYEPDEARLWLLSPQKLFRGEKPFDLIRGGRYQDVLKVVHQLQEGVYL